jgi:UDP-glucose 4-epimerase
MTRTALVTGAAGVIGRALAARLIAGGWRVRGLDRQPAAAGARPPGVVFYRGDLGDDAVLRQASQGADVVFHLAAKLHINHPSPDLDAEYYRTNVEGTSHVAEAAKAAGARRLVFFSTINVYGSTAPDQICDERSALHPTSCYAVTKAEAEKVALGVLPTTIVRLAAVYGPGVKGNYPRLLEALRRRRFAMIGNGQNRRTVVHLEDVCAAAMLVAEHPGAAGQTFNVTDGQLHTLAEIVESMCVALGRRPPRLRLPLGPTRLAAGIVENVCAGLSGKRIPLRAAVDKITEDIAVSGNRLINDLGFRPRYDLTQGWTQAVSDLAARRRAA